MAPEGFEPSIYSPNRLSFPELNHGTAMALFVKRHVQRALHPNHERYAHRANGCLKLATPFLQESRFYHTLTAPAYGMCFGPMLDIATLWFATPLRFHPSTARKDSRNRAFHPRGNHTYTLDNKKCFGTASILIAGMHIQENQESS